MTDFYNFGKDYSVALADKETINIRYYHDTGLKFGDKNIWVRKNNFDAKKN